LAQSRSSRRLLHSDCSLISRYPATQAIAAALPLGRATELPSGASSATPKSHRPRPTKQRPSYQRFPPWEAFEPRPHSAHDVPEGAGVRNRSGSSELPDDQARSTRRWCCRAVPPGRARLATSHRPTRQLELRWWLWRTFDPTSPKPLRAFLEFVDRRNDDQTSVRPTALRSAVADLRQAPGV
jgi:hypothetical protein